MGGSDGPVACCPFLASLEPKWNVLCNQCGVLYTILRSHVRSIVPRHERNPSVPIFLDDPLGTILGFKMHIGVYKVFRIYLLTEPPMKRVRDY